MSELLYVIEAATKENARMVKIGVSERPAERRDQLQTGNPYKLSLLTVMETDLPRKLEWAWHQYFSDYQMWGEWFRVGHSHVQELKAMGEWDDRERFNFWHEMKHNGEQYKPERPDIDDPDLPRIMHKALDD